MIKSQEPDCWSWTGSPIGRFSTREANTGLAAAEWSDTETDNHEAFQLLWKSAASRRSQAIGWKILKQRLPTRDELRKRGIIPALQDVQCPCCGVEEESISLFFFWLLFCKDIWVEIYKWSETSMVPHMDPKIHLESHSVILGDPNSVKYAVSIWLATVGSIWKARNKVVFEEVKLNLSKLIGEIKAIT
ncbi:hypothetical protein ACS0TY_021786 [Phlomoides rotata]